MNEHILTGTECEFRDPSRDPAPNPCPDCKRTYLNGENITIMVPVPDGGQRIVWSGCVDCWLIRTQPRDLT